MEVKNEALNVYALLREAAKSGIFFVFTEALRGVRCRRDRGTGRVGGDKKEKKKKTE